MLQANRHALSDMLEPARQAPQQPTPRLSFVRPYLLRMPLFDAIARITRTTVAPLPLALVSSEST